MQIVIDISEKVYKRMKLLRALSSDNECLKYILEGTPLPKGHGRLIDVDYVKKQFNGKEGEDFTAFHFYEAIDNAPTLIPADKEGEE